MRDKIFIIILLSACSMPLFSQNAKEIHESVRAGSLEKLKALIREDQTVVYQQDEDLRMPLHWAALYGHTQIAGSLIANKADINPVDKNNETPLHFAAFYEKYDMVVLLLKNQADVTIKTVRGRTPLHKAAYKKDASRIIKKLLEHGADINAKDNWDFTPLRTANRNGNSEIVKVLLDHNAALPTDNSVLRWDLHYAAENGHLRLIKKMEKHGMDLMQLNLTGGTFINSAAAGGSDNVIEYLLSKDVAVNKKNFYGMTPLHLAALNGKVSTVELLLKHHSEINGRCLQGRSAYDYAAESNKKEIARLLANKGADTSGPKFPFLKGKYLTGDVPPQEPEIFALGIISHSRPEHSPPVFSQDGKEVYWLPAWRMPIKYMRYVNGRWTQPQAVTFFSEYGDADPELSPDGSRLYFNSLRPEKKSREAGKENIWYVKRINNGWSEPKMVTKTVNSYTLHWKTSIAGSGNMYFGANQADGFGQGDIYFARNVNKTLSAPENLGASINSELEEISPYISPDESYLLFARTAQGDSDLFISFRDKNGSWTQARSLGKQFHTEHNEQCPWVSHDQKCLFFLSDKSGAREVYWVDASFIEDLRPKH